MNIVITGASKGIGFEAAKHLAAAGDHTIVAIARNEENLKQLKNACLHENIKAKVFPIQFDLGVLNGIETLLVKQILAFIPNVDILINNAGVLVNKPFAETSLEDIQETISTNYLAPSILIRALLPHFASGAHVVNISSMGGFQGSAKFAGLSAYSAAKGAIAVLTECLAEEYKDSGFRFNCLAFGAVNTEMFRMAFPGHTAPLEPGEMGKYVADFALNQARYFNGKVIPVSSATP